jgi:small redox-active disulfide protein 2
MKSIFILGPGCPRCDQLADNVRIAAETLGVDYQLKTVTNPQEIAAHGAVMTPALEVDGEIVLVGKVMPPKDLESLIG